MIASSLKSLRSLKSLMSHVIVKSITLTVILSAAKDPLAGNTPCAWFLVGFEEILHFVQNDNAWCRHCEEGCARRGNLCRSGCHPECNEGSPR